MNRVATRGNYQAALLNLMQAQKRGQTAQQQFASGKVGTSHGEFGRVAETITAMRSTQTRITGFLDTAKTTADRLTTQDVGLERIAASSTQTRGAIANALAMGRAEGLMTEVRSLFQAVQDGINTKHQGKYVFSGGAVDTVPSTVAGLDALAAMPNLDGVFKNDNLIQTSWVDENINLETGFLAADLGTELYGIFRDIAVFNQNEPFGSQLTETQKTFLTGLLARFDTATQAVVTHQATNGAILSRTDSIVESHTKRADTLEVMLSEKTDADLAQAVTELELSELAIQASAQVISQLRQTSLLDYLR